MLAALIERFRRREARAVACAYGGTVGAPVLFAPALFDRLSALTGDRGAKRAPRAASGRGVPGDELDIGTDADLHRAPSPV